MIINRNDEHKTHSSSAGAKLHIHVPTCTLDHVFDGLLVTKLRSKGALGVAGAGAGKGEGGAAFCKTGDGDGAAPEPRRPSSKLTLPEPLPRRGIIAHWLHIRTGPFSL